MPTPCPHLKYVWHVLESSLAIRYYEIEENVELNAIPGIALTESKVSAICCHLLEEDGDRREGGKVMTATAFESLIITFRDLIKESISHSYNNRSPAIRVEKPIHHCKFQV